MPVYNIRSNNITKDGIIKQSKGKGIIVFWSPFCHMCIKKKPVFKNLGKNKNVHVYMFELSPTNDVSFIDIKYVPDVHYVNKNGRIARRSYTDKVTKTALFNYIKQKN